MYIHGIYMNIQPISVRSRYHMYIPCIYIKSGFQMTALPSESRQQCEGAVLASGRAGAVLAPEEVCRWGATGIWNPDFMYIHGIYI